MPSKKAYLRKLAAWVSPETKRRLPPPGVEEAWKGRTEKPLEFKEFYRKWKFREVPEFPIPEERIREMYQDYRGWFKRKEEPAKRVRRYV